MPALEAKVIVIIGGTTGLGLSAAKACIAAGAKVVAVGLGAETVDVAREALGASARVLAGDATDPASAPAAISRAVDDFGACHALYHVAGGSGRRMGDGPLHEITDDGWRQTLDLNLTSLLYSNRAAVRYFLERSVSGAVLNMASVLAFSPSPAFFGTHAYAAAKAAVIGLTRSCAAFYAPRDIRFNAIAPALIDTPMSRRAAGDETIRAFVHAKQPLDGGRIGRPEDLDAAVVYLLSDAARFVTGQVLSVDGGWSVTEGQVPR
jgi:NAD(P)-dependent dehydrogenase (short-subunit alcohol dehydrogenase family)